MLDERGGFPTFGWAIACVGRPPQQVGEDVRALVAWSASTWTRSFPAERGYRVTVESPAEPAQGVRMNVRRGDFEADVAIEHDLPPRARGAGSANPSIRMFGRARAHAVGLARARGERWVQRGRVLGGAVGLGLFLLLAWLMIGVTNPVFMLGGMLLTVTLIMTLTAGATLGAYVGERLAAGHLERALREVERDLDMHDDVRRWKAVSRQLAAQRAVLLGHRRQPFRSEPGALAG